MTTTPDIESFVRDSQGGWTLDPGGSSAEFHVKHFWGAITVHGRFERLEGAGTVAQDGTVNGTLRLDGASVTTKNKKRDEHLRSADFFHVEHHPTLIVTVDQLTPGTGGGLTGNVRLDAAGHTQTINPTIEVVQAAPGSVTLSAEAVVDRTKFGMTWSPLGMASSQARAVITARFVRA
jgi:polyisoprenoid-binding protein YceI